MFSKSIFKSSTFWINVGVAVAAWLLHHEAVMSDAGIDAHAQLFIIAIANIVLRYKTTEAVHVIEPKAPPAA